MWTWLAWTGSGALALYAAFIVALLLAGRREQARALAGVVPDLLVLVRRLLGDPRVPGRWRVSLVLLAVYLASPVDVVPDVLPIVGQLDDVLLAAWVLRRVLRAGGEELLSEHWPGPEASRQLLARLVF